MRFSLKEYNTFAINALCEKAVRINSEEKLKNLIERDANEKLIIGCGSNILLTRDVHETVLLNEIIGKQVLEENSEYALVRFGGGELWHECVEWAIENDYGGIENLAWIPGSMGAAPIQNIGAYGVELKDVFHSLEALDLIWGEKKIFTKEECKFGYRDSVFKNELKGEYFITKVTLKLTTGVHELHLDYGDIRKVLEENEATDIDIADVCEAVIEIRDSKLPDPEEFPNAGSFFKNPIVKMEKFEKLKSQFPDIKHFINEKNNTVKIPAAWLIERCGWKGKKMGKVGVHDKQALVIINYDDASGKEVLDFSKKVQKSVEAKFGILLVAEVNVI
jgi:UDP-N-acetylmuramate dehydrogenase